VVALDLTGIARDEQRAYYHAESVQR
jgi:hypothetical protein